ncbi:hypothetical protein [Halorussus ruber]|nr:hypothetical protein [Halorussus ruber]
MPADTSSDLSGDENEEPRHDELTRAIEEFAAGETPTTEEVRKAFLS